MTPSPKTVVASPRWRWTILPAIGLVAAWLIASHFPKPDRFGVDIGGNDKWVHGVGYSVMACAWMLWLCLSRNAPAMRAGLAAWFAFVALGALDEVTQPWFGRACDIGDWAADSLGAGLGCLSLALVFRRRQLTSSSRVSHA